MRRIFISFILPLLTLSSAFSWELTVSRAVLFPGATEEVKIHWDTSSAGEGVVYTTLKLPGGRVLYVVNGETALSQDPVPEDTLSLGNLGVYTVLSLQHTNDAWLPPGEYTVTVQVFSENGTALSPLLSGKFLVASRRFPITYKGYDSNAVDFKVAHVDDGYWIAFPDYLGTVYATKISGDGHVLIPPFSTGATHANINTYSIIPDSKGGFYLLCGIYSPTIRYSLLYLHFNRKGHLLNKSIITTSHGTIYYPWMSTLNGHRVFTYVSNRKLQLLVQGVKKPVVVSQQGEHVYFYRVGVDEDSGRLILLYGSGDMDLYFLRVRPDGSVETFKKLIDGSVYSSSTYRCPGALFRKGNLFYDFFVSYGSGTHPFILILDSSGNFSTVQVPYAHGGYSYRSVVDGQHLYLVWNNSYKYCYAQFDLSGNTTTETSCMPVSRPERAPAILITPEGPLMLFISDGALEGSFIGYDYPRGQDLVVSSAEISHHPGPFARLGTETELKLKVSNRGEKPSAPATLTVSYMGGVSQANVPVLAPGESSTVTATLQQPRFLTEMPLFSVELDADNYHRNNSISGYIVFPPNTPIMPQGTRYYQWLVLNRATGQPISHPHLRYELHNIETVSGVRQSLRITLRGDAQGQVATALPPGTHLLTVYKHGYPTTYTEVSVPGNVPENLYLTPPGNLTVSFSEEGNATLHPLQKVSVHIEHLEDPSMPMWSSYKYDAGGDARVVMENVMPGNYTLRAKAFGYRELTATIEVIGGRNNTYALALTPEPRTTVQGRVVSGSSGVSGATVSVTGLPYSTRTSSDGLFSFDDFPIEPSKHYSLVVEKDGYQTRFYQFSVPQEDVDLGDIAVKQVYRSTFELNRCRYAAWFQDVQWSVGDSYQINTLYGVWDMEGKLHYKQVEGSSSLDIDQLDLKIEGLRWSYWGLNVDIASSLANWFLEGLGEGYQWAEYLSQTWETYDWATTPENFIASYSSVANPLGTVQGGVVDCGDLDVLSDLSQPDSLSDTTVVRIDDIKIYDGSDVVFRLRDEGLYQLFSSDYNGTYINIPIHLRHPVSSKDDIKVALYLFVENGDMQTAPLDLYGTNRLRLEFRVKGSKLVLQGMEGNPPDYPVMEE